MKITHRQLSQIIREELDRVLGEARDFHKGYLVNYLDWVRDSGHITPASSSVMATYFLDKGMEDDQNLQRHLASAVRIDHEDVMRDMGRQRRDLIDTDGDGALDADELRALARELEGEVSSYDLGREDSFAGIRPQLSNQDYMMGYNEAQMDAGLSTMQPPTDSSRGKKLDPNLLRGALPGKRWGNK